MLSSLFLDKKRTLTGPPVTKIYKKNEDFFIQLIYGWLHLTKKKTSLLSYQLKKFLTTPYI